MKKQYYRIEFELESPLSLGNGENTTSDSDVLLDSRGVPYIPGSSLAGAYRAMFSAETADRYFGRDLTQERKKESAKAGRNNLTESSVLVYDAMLLDPEKRRLTVRDMVALDEFKTGIPGAKFDFQVLEPGVHFVTYIEQNIEDTGAGADDARYVAAELACAWQQGRIRLGAKTSRGYGQTRCFRIAQRGFDLARGEELDTWLAFDMYGDEDWQETKEVECLSSVRKDTPEHVSLAERYRASGISLKEGNACTLTLELKQSGGISVRQYSTDVSNRDNGTSEPDYMQMTLADGTPVIPGTSWAGAFRAQMEKLDPSFGRNGRLAELFFGAVKSSEEAHKARVAFSESRIADGRSVIYTRNAVDRFSGGTINGALYTEKTYYDGETRLEIRCNLSGIAEEDVRHFMQILAAAILDLHRGYLAVGGLTSVGHGMFLVKSVRTERTQIDFSGQEPGELYRKLLDALA